MVVYWVILGIVASSLSGIFATVLYIYAKTGKVSPGFDPDLVMNAFKQKKGKTQNANTQPPPQPVMNG